MRYTIPALNQLDASIALRNRIRTQADDILPNLSAKPISDIQDPVTLSVYNHDNADAFRDWETANLFIDQIDDSANFNLGENTVAWLSALLTGLAMLLFTDLVFRIVVRGRDCHVSSHTIFRSALLARFANPLSWLSDVGWQRPRRDRKHISSASERAPEGAQRDIAVPNSQRSGQDRPWLTNSGILPIRSLSQPIEPTSSVLPEQAINDVKDSESQETRTPSPRQTINAFKSVIPQRRSIPAWGRIVIICMGLLITLSQLLFIYLATNQNTIVRLDLRKIPAFELGVPSDPRLILPVDQLCSSRPIMSKEGFSASASILLCTPASPHADDTVTDPSQAIVALAWVDAEVKLYVFTPGLYVIYDQSVAIGLENGTQYTSISSVTQREAIDILPQVLARHGVSVLRNSNERDVPGVPLPNWAAVFYVQISDAVVPNALRDVVDGSLAKSALTAGNVTAGSLARNQLLGAASRSSLQLTARTRAFHKSVHGPFLDEVDDALVTSQRPWLSVAACAILCASLLAAWLFVVFVLRWRADVDGRWAWRRVFVGIDHDRDFGDVAEQKILLV